MVSFLLAASLSALAVVKAEAVTSPEYVEDPIGTNLAEAWWWKKGGYGGFGGGGYTTIGSVGGEGGGQEGGFTSGFTSYFTETIPNEVTTYITVPGVTTTIYAPTPAEQVTTLFTVATSLVTVFGNGGAGTPFTTVSFTQTL